jgi:hypothetical protein
VPGKRQDQYGNDHSLYKRKQNSWTKTNIDTHISIVKNSGRIIEIAATKIWCAEHNIDFPSIFLELVVINALKGHSKNDIYQATKTYNGIIMIVHDMLTK